MYSLEQANVNRNGSDINSEVAKKLLGFDSKEAVLSVSRIEKYNLCPYSFLLDYGFNLKPRKEFVMESVDIGSLMHAVIEKASKAAAASDGGIKALDRKLCSEIVDSVFDEAVLEVSDDGSIFLGTERSTYMTAKMKRIAENELNNMSEQLKFNMLQPYGFEMKYGFGDEDSLPPVRVSCEDGFDVLLRGKIDRVDVGEMRSCGDAPDAVAPVYFRVIDYKSSANSVTVGDIVGGIKYQLITYIAAVAKGLSEDPKYKDREIVPAAAFYYTFNKDIERLSEHFSGDFESVKMDKFMNGLYLLREDSMHTLHGGVMEIKKNFDKSQYAIPDGGFERLFSQAEKGIAETAVNMKKGSFPIRPIIKPDGRTSCTYCDYKAVCLACGGDAETQTRIKTVSAEEFWQGDK